MSLRLKTALLLSILLGTALLAFGVGMHVAIERMTRQVAERELAERAQALVATNSATRRNAIQAPFEDIEDQIVVTRVQIFQWRCSLPDIAGRMQRLIQNGRVLPLSDDGLLALQDGQPWVEQSQVFNEIHLVYSQPIMTRNRIVGVAQVAQPFGEQERMLTTMRDGLLVASGAAAALAFGLTWGLAGRALRPIARMTHEARSIATHRDFARRLRPGGAGDEFSQLSSSLNAALGALHDAYRRAEADIAAQRDVVADVSHELRAPLTTVRGNLGLLQRESPLDDAERKAVLRDAVDEVERMSRLVNEMLLLTRAGEEQSLRLSPVDLAELASDVCRKAAALTQGRTILFDPGGHASIVRGNADALAQVLLILIDNAVKFTPPDGSIAIVLSADAYRACVAVRDSGPGIAPEALPHVFERRYRADDSQHGTGLGLAIARSLIEAQQGDIAVQSVPGQGSIFIVTLPLAA